jgi:hypothetical protein
MSNTQVMQTAVTSAIKLIVIMLCTIISGMTVPFVISVVIAGLSSQATLEDCVSTFPFVLFSALGMLVTAVYIYEEIHNKD